VYIPAEHFCVDDSHHKNIIKNNAYIFNIYTGEIYVKFALVNLYKLYTNIYNDLF